MINSGLGLCVEIGSNKFDQKMFVQCKMVDGDVVVRKETPTPYIVASFVEDNHWGQGHYFENLEDAVAYLNRTDF